MSFYVVTDSAANIPTRLLREKRIEEVTLSYTMRGEVLRCEDLDSFDGKAYFDALRNREIVSTSLVNPSEFKEKFEPMLKAGKDVLYIGLSSAVSGTLQAARLAGEELAEELGEEHRVYVFDSLGAALGEGMQAFRAAELRDEGYSCKEAYDVLMNECQHMIQVFTVGDLKHLHRTGRLSGISALVGSTLHVNALLKGNEHGQIVSYGKTIGRKRAISMLADAYKQKHDPTRKQLVCITHCDCEPEANALAEKIRQIDAPDEILIVCYEPVTGSHVGPDTLALFFMGDKR